jgi:tRNA (mo5U34)-methyltransferase
MRNRWKYLSEFLPADLSGKRVLDIGCNGGFFSLQLKQRNARQVTGIDIMPHCLAQSRFVSHWFGQPIELRQMSAYDVPSLGEFDIVNFIGVLYHLRHPLYAIDQVASICKDVMYLQSVIRGDTRDFLPAADYPQNEQDVFKRPEFPRMYFVEKSFNGDESNWWVPNTSCLMAMARSAGFTEVRQSSHPELIVCRK